MGETGRYLYAIGRGLAGEDVADVPGLDGGSLDVVERHGLTAVVSSVDLDEYGEEGLRRNLEDLTWLERVARTHDAVVHAAAAHAPTAPLRLATICLGDDQVRARLDEWREPLERALERVTGRMEWSVKAFAEQNPSAEKPAAAARAGAGAGAAYLQRRKAETARREETAEDSARLADELHAALSGFSVASRRLAPQDPRLTGHEGTMTLNGAYLVDEASTDEFCAGAESLGDRRGVRLEVQGPWPPYSFATLDES